MYNENLDKSEVIKEQNVQSVQNNMTNEQAQNRDKRMKQAYRELKVRNRYFDYFYRKMIVLFTLSLVGVLSSFLLYSYYSSQNVPPGYIPTDNEMRYFSPIPLSKYNKTDADIQTFTMDAMSDLFAFDYINSNKQLNKNQNNFTGAGWVKFVQAMKKSFVIQNVIDNKWIATYKQIGVPKIVKKAVSDDGIAYWLVETKGQVVYYGQSSRTDVVDIKIKIERVPVMEKDSGIGIATFVYTIEE